MFEIGKKGAADTSSRQDVSPSRTEAGGAPRPSTMGRDAAVIGPSIHIDGDVRGEVVDREEWFARRHRQRLSGRSSDQQSADQPRSSRHSDGVEVCKRYAGVRQGARERGRHGFQVRPARHLWHHSAEPGLLIDTARDGVRQQCGASHDADAGLVA